LVPAAYASWIDHYAYLRPDVICLVPDPIGHVLADAPFLPDRRSLAFRAFGYSPILPLVLQEKGTLSHSAPLRLVGTTLETVDRATGDRTRRPDAAIAGGADYAAAIDSAVRAGLRSASVGVLVVLAPARDNRGMKERLAMAFAGERVRLVDLGDDARMLDPGLRLDGFSFSAGGHAVAAENVLPAVLGLLGDAGRRTP
jgi:hypothetical protein